MPALTCSRKITFAEMRDSGVRGVLVYRQNYQCSHSTKISAERWPDECQAVAIFLIRFWYETVCLRGLEQARARHLGVIA